MSGTSYLVDTNIVLYLLGGDQTLAGLLTGASVFVSEISEIELLSYPDITPQEEVKINEFLQEVSIIEMNAAIKAFTIDLRRKYRLKMPDSIIAATAQHWNLPLLSADQKMERVEEITFFLYEL